LPKLARSVARAYGTIRRTADDFRRSLLMDDELRKPIDEIRGAYRDARWEMQQASRKMMTELKQISDETRQAVEIDLLNKDDESASNIAVESQTGRVPASVNDESQPDTPKAGASEGASTEASSTFPTNSNTEAKIVAKGSLSEIEAASVPSDKPSESYEKASESTPLESPRQRSS